MTTRSLRRGSSLLLGLAAASLAIAACTSSTSTSEPSGSQPASPSPDASLAAMVPAEIKDSGKMTFGTDASYAPNQFFDEDGETIIGMDVDLGNAIAAKLGLTGEFENASFGGIIVSVDKGRFSAGMSSFTINPERLQQANMVSYFSAGTAWATQPGNPKGIDPDDACGKVIAVQRATVQADDIEAKNTECTKAGKPSIDVQSYELQTQATAAVQSGKADAMLADSPVVAYAIQQSAGKLEQLGEIYDSAPYGVVVAKKDTQFAEAIAGAIDSLIADGTYQQILQKWNVQDGAITKAEVNPKP